MMQSEAGEYMSRSLCIAIVVVQMRCVWFSIIISSSAFGCSNPTAPGGGSVERRENHALITCESTNVQWEITCKDGHWQGDFGECSECKQMRHIYVLYACVYALEIG